LLGVGVNRKLLKIKKTKQNMELLDQGNWNILKEKYGEFTENELAVAEAKKISELKVLENSN